MMFTAENVSIGYPVSRKKVKTVQQNLSFTLPKNQLTCLLGRNGSGKSTLLKTLCGILPTLSGRLLLNQKPLLNYKRKELAQKIGLVLTDKIEVTHLKVNDVVALGRYMQTDFFGTIRHADRKMIDDALEKVGMLYKQNSFFSELSDGERQKIMIAKALVQECELLILDEPTAFLDITGKVELMRLLKLLTRQGTTVLMATHDLQQALQTADTLWLVSKKYPMTCDTVENVVKTDMLSQFFETEEVGV